MFSSNVNIQGLSQGLSRVSKSIRKSLIIKSKELVQNVNLSV